MSNFEFYKKEAVENNNSNKLLVEIPSEEDIIKVYEKTLCYLTTKNGKNNLNIISRGSKNTKENILKFIVYLYREKNITHIQIRPAEKYQYFKKKYKGLEENGVIYFDLNEVVKIIIQENKKWHYKK